MTGATEAVVRLRSAAFGYAGRPVVTGLDLTVRRGEVVALLGPNGSGKSTLVRGLLGLNDHLGGRAELFGTPLADFRRRTLLGYVPQRHTLSGSVRSTVREVVTTGRLPHRRWWQPLRREDRRAVEEALATVGLLDRATTDVATLSGGQQRRVLIARALAAQPEVLIMDEPTAGVDAGSQLVLGQVLRRLVATGVTMVVVTHELAALRGVVDRIVEMDAGHVTFDGTPKGYAQHQAHAVAATSAASHGHHHDEELAPEPPGLLGTGPLDAPLSARERREG
ncbi:metal ABC transporter ATP-binding protein [Ornithinicoccus halotolerans]|uniref:metal ABC transporter ATP-binding protein n=1 Tax=Ornithinicoccus halotolerans TaxID=1748220 RepID=UPI001E419284|nr:metal ABC transporter ATP-binding protein [Ornithinicoccus halotolerans]